MSKKAPKRPAVIRPNGIAIESEWGEIEVVACEPPNRTLAEEISYLDFCLSDDWPPSFASAYKAKAVEAAFTLENHDQREWLIEHSALHAHFDGRRICEQDADVWIAIARATRALNEGNQHKARQFFHEACELRDAMNAAMPETKAMREARSEGGRAIADKQQPVMANCAKLILGPSITKANLATQIALATKLAPAASKYIRDHRDELKGSQLANHAGKNLTTTIRRWLSKTEDNVVRKAYVERRRQEGLPPR